MALWHGYMLMKKPAALSSNEWATYRTYIEARLNETPSADQPAQRLHYAVSGDSVIYESTFETDELSTAQLATWLVAALPSYTQQQAEDLLENTEGRRWQPMAQGANIDGGRVAYRKHAEVFGLEPMSPRDGAGDTWYVATDGSASNDGSLASPWTLEHVLSGGAGVQQKDTVYLRGGTYNKTGADGTGWTCNVVGYDDEHIIFRGYPADWKAGNPPVIKPELTVLGPWVRFRNIVFTGRQTERHREEGTGESGVSLLAPYVDFYGCISHDNDSNGIASQSGGDGGAVYMSLVFNNGRLATDDDGGDAYDGSGARVAGAGSGVAHGAYVQSDDDAGKNFSRSVFFNNFSNQVSVHGSGGTILNVSFDRCAILNGVFNSGDQSVLEALGLTNSHLDNARVKLGNKAGNDMLTCTGNRVRAAAVPLASILWTGATITGNTVIMTADSDDVFYILRPFTGTIDNNAYYGGDINPFRYEGEPGERFTFAQWQAQGWDANSTHGSGEPDTNEVFVYANEHKDANDPIVGIVVIWNWETAAAQTCDLSGLGMVNASNYKIYNALNRFGDTPIDHASDGDDSSVSITLSGWSIAIPEGTYDAVAIAEALTPMPDKLRVFIVEEA